MVMTLEKALTIQKRGVAIRIHVTTGRHAAQFPTGYNEWRNAIEIAVRADPKNNQANKEIIHVVASFFNVSDDAIQLIAGNKSRDKTLLITNHSPEQIRSKIEEALHGL